MRLRRELHRLIIRRAEKADHPSWAALLARLHPDQTTAEFEAELEVLTALAEPYVAFLAWAENGRAVGVVDARVRNYAEGAPNLAAPYVEDLWVEPDHRSRGVATQLLEAVEGWARELGYRWLGSDTTIDNTASCAWHQARGFAEMERLVVFGKPLD
jgi:aminoglycoside 6'-N-acetyltransferase I